MIPMKTLKMNDDIFEITDGKARESLNFDKSATQGYILTATDSGNGTQWSPVGLPTDEQTADAVSDWLDNHPEATTTVLDGSITTAKLHNEAVTEAKTKTETLRLYNLRLGDDELGAMVVLVFPNGKVIVCDTALASQAGAIDTFMESQNIDHIDILITTHFHTDHIGSFEHVAQTYCDENTVFYRCMDWDTSEIGYPSLSPAEYEAIIEGLGATSVIPTQNQIVEPWDYCKLRFLNTDPSFLTGYYSATSDSNTTSYTTPTLNNLSLITEVTFINRKILLCGDLEKIAQANNAAYIQKVDVLQIPHHNWNMNGDHTFFLNANPELAFFNRNNALTYYGGTPHYWDRVKMRLLGEIPTMQTLTEHVVIDITKPEVRAVSGNIYNYTDAVSYSDRRITRCIPGYKSTANFWEYNSWSIDDVISMISESEYLEDAFIPFASTTFMITFISQLKNMTGSNSGTFHIRPFKNGFELELPTKQNVRYIFTSGFHYADSSTYSEHFFVIKTNIASLPRENVSENTNIKSFAETLEQGVHFKFMYNFTNSDFPCTGNVWVMFLITSSTYKCAVVYPIGVGSKFYKSIMDNGTWGNWIEFSGSAVSS